MMLHFCTFFFQPGLWIRVNLTRIWIQSSKNTRSGSGSYLKKKLNLDPTVTKTSKNNQVPDPEIFLGMLNHDVQTGSDPVPL